MSTIDFSQATQRLIQAEDALKKATEAVREAKLAIQHMSAKTTTGTGAQHYVQQPGAGEVQAEY